MSRLALAQSAGVSNATVSHIESEQRLPSVGTVACLATALGLSAAWLAYGLGEPASDGLAATIEGMGERLRVTRTERGHSKAALAKLADLSAGAILGIENGGQAGVDTVERLAKELHISPAWLAYGIGLPVVLSRRAIQIAQTSAPTL